MEWLARACLLGDDRVGCPKGCMMERLWSNRVVLGLAILAIMLIALLALAPSEGSQAPSQDSRAETATLECPSGSHTEMDLLYADQSGAAGILEQDPIAATESLLGTELLPDLDASSDVAIVYDDDESVVVAIRLADGQTAALVTFTSGVDAGWVLDGVEACA
jgi:hypothetical protein